MVLGTIAGPFGVQGWIRVHSDTQPRSNILDYAVWQVESSEGWRALRVEDGRMHRQGIVARLEGCGDRDAAAAMAGARIAVFRHQLPALPAGEYYWTDLEGLRVRTTRGSELGHVERLFETGANDVLVVRGADRERLVPFVPERVVKEVDLEAGLIVVDWDPDF